jgi:2-polyprenyl-6-methoxyphenol hydroxylase-like FAD-dependent oxidoreductase
MTPNIGQGACQAIEDGLTVAECLSKEPTIEAAFDVYEARRFARTAGFIREARRLGWLAQREGVFFCALRNLLLRSLPDGFQARRMARSFRRPASSAP